MAVVKIGQIRATLNKAIAYITDAYKTDGRTLVTSNAVMDPAQVGGIVRAFKDVQDLADRERTRGKRPTVLGVHITQSFSPGEISPDEAHRLGVEFIERVTGGEYQYVVATHVDRHHVHNHIIMNPCSMTTLKRWRIPRTRLAELRRISDELCLTHGLSIIEQPGREAVSLGEVYARTRGASTKDNLRALIDNAVSDSASMKQLRERLTEQGLEVTARRGSLVIRDPSSKGHGMRSERLGTAYGQAALMARLGREEKREFVVRRSQIENLDKNNVLVHADGLPDDGALVVNRADLIDNGTSFRMFLNANQTHPVVDRFDRTGGAVTVEELEGVFPTPRRELPVVGSTAPVRIERGMTDTQRRYFARVDGKVAALRAKAEEINVNIRLGDMTPAQLKEHIADLQYTITLHERELAALLVEKQRAIDAGASELDLGGIDVRISTKTAQVQAAQKERTMAIKRQPEQERRPRR